MTTASTWSSTGTTTCTSDSRPRTSAGKADAARGIRQFTVGTGGATLYGFGTPASNSETRASVHGVLKLYLQASGYAWEFIPVAGQSYRDGGTGSCH